MLDGFPGLHFEGHALVSTDGMIADQNSRVPPALHNEADWAQFQAALDTAVIVASGRKGHETHPNPRRRRLVLTRSVATTETDGNATFWNPSGMPLGDVLTRLGIGTGTLVVAGVYDAFAPYIDRFVLSEMHRLVIPGGTACFSTGHPRTVLAALGLRPLRSKPLDRSGEVTLTEWSRS